LLFFSNAVNRNVVHSGTFGLQCAISGRKGTKNIFNNRHFEQKSRDREPKEGQLAILSHHQQPIFRTQRQGETEEIITSCKDERKVEKRRFHSFWGAKSASNGALL
jgi:hypothetical protein